METRKTSSVALHALSFFFVAVSASPRTARAQSLPPPHHDGFVYGNHPVKRDAILIEAWLDPVCPVSRDAWKPLKQAVNHYGPRVLLVVHPFRLPPLAGSILPTPVQLDSLYLFGMKIVFRNVYGCTRGVYGIPFFFVNGFALSDATSPVNYNGWRKLIDPLVDTRLAKSEE